MLGTYDLPGGAYGSLTTSVFSLADYGPDTNPLVTFTYFLETDGVTSNTVTDSARVFVSNDGVTWTLVASNIDTDLSIMPDDQHDPTRPGYVLPLADGTGQWHQATIDLSGWANMDNLRLKFEFSTAGGMQTGIENRGPDELRGLQLQRHVLPRGRRPEVDRRRYVQPRRPLTGEVTTFEFDKGYSLLMPNSAGMMIPDGATLSIDSVVQRGGLDHRRLLPAPGRRHLHPQRRERATSRSRSSGPATAWRAGHVAVNLLGVSDNEPGGREDAEAPSAAQVFASSSPEPTTRS